MSVNNALGLYSFSLNDVISPYVITNMLYKQGFPALIF